MNLTKHILFLLCLTIAVSYSNLAGASAVKADVVRTITVSGSGSFSVEADKATIAIGIENIGKNAQEAEQHNARVATAVQENLLQLGLKSKDIVTTRYSFYPVYSNERNKQHEVTGYTVNNTISVTVNDLSLVGTVIDSSIRAGANTINSINFSVKATDAMSKKALQAAVQAATTKANTMAAALGKKIVNVVTVKEYSTAVEERRVNYALKSASFDTVQTPIQPGNIDVNATVEITFELE